MSGKVLLALTIACGMLLPASGAEKTGEKSQTLLTKAKEEVESCQFDKAICTCDEAIKSGLNNSEVHVWRGCAYMHTGDFSHAREDFIVASSLQKGSGDYWIQRVRDAEYDESHKEADATHRWALACTAIQFTKDKLCSKSLAGLEVNEHSVEKERQLLQGRMNVASNHDLERVLAAMDEKIAKSRGDKAVLAWDMSLYICICRWGYLAGFVSEHEAWSLIMPKAKEIQKSYSSWQDFAEHYMNGRKAWDEKAYERDKELFERAIRRLGQNPRSPWNQLAWDMSLK